MVDDATDNRVRKVLANGERAVTGMMLQHLRADVVVHLAANAGLDTLVIDMEHGTYTLDEVAALVGLCRRLGLVPLVRPPDHTYAAIARVLDCGARGILAPRIVSAADVRTICAAMKFPPKGERGMASQLGHTDYSRVPDRLAFAERMNADTLLIVQVELAEAIEAIDEIIAEPGVDVALVGPGDLDLSLAFARAGDLDQAIRRVLKAGRTHGVPIGIQVSDLDQLTSWREAGMQVLFAGTEGALLARAMHDLGARLRDVAALVTESGP